MAGTGNAINGQIAWGLKDRLIVSISSQRFNPVVIA
jgi:hypothetical protein